MGANGTLFLINGKRLSGEVKNPYDLDRIPASMIERIEVVKGPMSSLYGADAVGGVVNIIMKKPKEGFAGSVGAKYGSNIDGDGENYGANFNVRAKKGKLSYSFNADGSWSKPYTQRERAKTLIGSQRKPSNNLPTMPGYLNPNGKTGGKPFYLQGKNPPSPKPIDASKLESDKTVAMDSFQNFRNQLSSHIKTGYDTDVTYREEADVFNFGTRLEYEFHDKVTAGLDLDYMKEERWGVYNGYFHPMGFKPPTGHKKNPIVGHKPDGTAISLLEAKKKILGPAAAFNVPVNSHDENERRNIGGDLRYLLNDDLSLKLNIYNSYYEKRNTTTMKEWQDFGYPNEAKSAASGMSANVDITSYELSSNYVVNENHLFTIGGEYRDEKREATVFDNTPGFSKKSVDYQAFYLQDEWEISDTLNIVLGGRYDAISNADNKATFRVGVVKNLSDALNLRFNFAQGYRTPDIREMYIYKQTPAGMQRGAESVGYNLKPEFTNSYEIGLSGKRKGFDYTATLFYNQVDDQIEQVKRGEGVGYWTFENVSEAETYGVETTLGYGFDSGAYLSLSWNELQTENKDTKKELEFNPDRTITVGADIPIKANWNAGILATYTGKQHYTKNSPQGKKDVSTDTYTLVDLTSSYKFGKEKKYEIYGGVNNIFDEKVEDILGSNVGTYVYLGLRANF
jgi:outer membrane receptor for ferrienterochelin and colicins